MVNEAQTVAEQVKAQQVRDKYESEAIGHANEKLMKLYDKLEESKVAPASVLLGFPAGTDLLSLMTTAASIDPTTGRVSGALLEEQLAPVMEAFANSRNAALQKLSKRDVKKLYSTLAARINTVAEEVPENRREAWIKSAIQGIEAQTNPETFQGPKPDDRQGAAQVDVDVNAVQSGIDTIVGAYQDGRSISPEQNTQLAQLFERYKDDPLLLDYADTMYATAAEQLAKETGQDADWILQQMSNQLKEAIDNGRDAFFMGVG